ncbi:VENN motif pre-toxin domain-containing protein [Pasteurella multocida]|uniref:VENN motif pre-toxin domain-containing protein n=2 Tax=Pasteurella multocida TaxID=747 RepID=UPI0039FC4A1E
MYSLMVEQTGNQTEITQKQTALFAAEEAQAKWGDKGEYKRTAERLTTLLTGILAKQAAGGIATQLISPEVNQWIKEATTNDKGETDKIANTLAHAIWGGIEATANRGNPTSGAIAAASAELAAPMLAKVLYNKDKAEQLTAEEKAQITALSSITAAVAGGLTAQGSSQSNTTVSSLTHASIGGEIGKIAVENNFNLNLFIDNPQVDWVAFAEGQEKADEATRQAIERFAKEHPELVEGLRNTGDVALFLADFTPIVGDIKSFSEAEDGIDYALAFISIVPGTEAVTKPLKKAKSALQKAKEAERLGNSAEALKYQREVAKQLDYVQDNANLGRNRSGFNFLLNENINSKIKSINPPKLIFDKSKYDYLFGNVRFDIHNSSRAFQNKQQLSSIGIYNDQRGRNIIEKTLEKMLSDKVYVKESFSKNINGKHQNFEIRESIIIGSGGIRKIEVTFEVMNDGSRRFITTILKGGN